MFARFSIFLVLLAVVSARPVPRLVSEPVSEPVPRGVRQFRDVKSDGPEGTIDLRKRWFDAVGTALQVFMNGAVLKNTVLHATRTGPLSSVYRDALRAVRQPCENTDDYQCEVGINGFGTTGEVQYDFTDAIRNVRGRSTQIMISCKCLGTECGSAILIRPINVFENVPPKRNEEPVQRTCIYEVVGNGFTDCHTEVLRSVRRKIHHKVEYTHGKNAFVYNVNKQDLQANWTARGQRGWTRDCSVNDIASLETVSSEDLPKSNIRQHHHSTPPANGCKPPEGVKYFREENDTKGEECYASYEYASAAASHLASMQDDIAIGNVEATFVDPKPELVTDTELALSCSAAGLGVLFVWELFRTQLKKNKTSGKFFIKVIVSQILSYALEGLPLHMALGQEVHARDWMSEFAFIDGSLAVATDQPQTQGSAQGSILVLTSVLGTVRYEFTRVTLVAGFAALFDVIAVVIIIETFVKQRKLLKEVMSTATDKLREEKEGWKRHGVGLNSREMQRREWERLQSQRREGEGNQSAGFSSDHLTFDVSSTNASVDIADDMFIVPAFGESLDVEGGFSDGMRRRGSSSRHHSEDLMNASQEIAGAQSDSRNEDGRSAQ